MRSKEGTRLNKSFPRTPLGLKANGVIEIVSGKIGRKTDAENRDSHDYSTDSLVNVEESW